MPLTVAGSAACEDVGVQGPEEEEAEDDDDGEPGAPCIVGTAMSAANATLSAVKPEREKRRGELVVVLCPLALLV